MSFGTLRKTSATWILKLSGSEAVQQMHLSHSRKSIAARHYTGELDFASLYETLAKFRQVLIDADVLSSSDHPQAA